MESEEFEFNDDEHQIVTLDEALEIIEDELDADMQGDSGDEDLVEQSSGPDTSIAHFASHSANEQEPVYCISAHPRCKDLAVSGGGDDHAFLFQPSSGQEVAKLSGHTDSVIAAEFSADGEYVATGGMDGKVRLWRRVKPQTSFTSEDDISAWSRWEFLTNLEGPDEVTTLKWHPRGLVLLGGSNDGTVWMWNLPSGNSMAVFAAHTSAIAALSWLSPSAGKRILSASSTTAEVCVWDPKTSLYAPAAKYVAASDDARFTFGEEGITCLAVNSAGTMALVGGAERAALRVINLVSGGFVASLSDSKQGHRISSSIEAVAWVDLTGNSGLWISAASDGSICAWESTNGHLRWKSEHPQPPLPEEETTTTDENMAVDEGTSSKPQQEEEEEMQEDDASRISISCLTLHSDPTGSRMFLTTAAADGSVYTWDARSGQALAHYEGHAGAVHTVATSGDLVLSGGDDGIVRVHRMQLV